MTEYSGNKGFTAADIERYHAGTLPAEQMHALEKAALDDPFLADALEGYTYTSTPVADLEAIRKRLQSKEEKTIIVPLWRRSWMRAAAVIAVVVTGALIAYRMGDNKKDSVSFETAVQKKNAATADSTVPLVNNNPPLIADSVNAETNTPASTSIASNGNVRERFRKAIQKDSSAVAFQMKAENDFAARSVLVENKAADKAFFKAQAQQKRSTVRVMSGPTNNAIFNSSTAYNNQVTIAPASAPAKETWSTLTSDSMKSAYTQEKAREDTIRNFNIVLQPDNTGLAEVTISTEKLKAADRKVPYVRFDTLEPADGWAKYDEYIAANIKLPEELKTKPAAAGEVELAFEISSNGRPVNITVTRSLCGSCDEEAIRLLKDGPRWQKTKDKKGRLTIRF